MNSIDFWKHFAQVLVITVYMDLLRVLYMNTDAIIHSTLLTQKADE